MPWGPSRGTRSKDESTPGDAPIIPSHRRPLHGFRRRWLTQALVTCPTRVSGRKAWLCNHGPCMAGLCVCLLSTAQSLQCDCFFDKFIQIWCPSSIMVVVSRVQNRRVFLLFSAQHMFFSYEIRRITLFIRAPALRPFRDGAGAPLNWPECFFEMPFWRA